jgi:hypothetical protein
VVKKQDRKERLTVCKIEDCEKNIFGRGMCSMHYFRAKRSGSEEFVKKEIEIENMDDFWEFVKKEVGIV